MDCSMPGLPDPLQLPEFTQTHVHWVDDAIQPSHLLSSPSPRAFIDLIRPQIKLNSQLSHSAFFFFSVDSTDRNIDEDYLPLGQRSWSRGPDKISIRYSVYIKIFLYYPHKSQVLVILRLYKRKNKNLNDYQQKQCLLKCILLCLNTLQTKYKWILEIREVWEDKYQTNLKCVSQSFCCKRKSLMSRAANATLIHLLPEIFHSSFFACQRQP